MASFADMFAGFGDNLNAGLNNLTGTPLGQLGINMLAASGPMQGNPGNAARLGQALSGMSQMQYQNAKMQQSQQLRGVQQQEIALRMAQMKKQQDQEQAIKSYFQQNPDALKNSPLAAAVMGATGDTGMGADMLKFQPPPKVGAMPFETTQQLPNNQQQQMRLNPQTMQYEPSGAAFTPTAQQSVDARVAQNQQSNQFKTQDQAFEQQRLSNQTEAQKQDAIRANALAMDAERKQKAAQLKGTIAKTDLEAGYNGAVRQMDDSITMAKKLRDHPGFAGNFGGQGVFPNTPGSEASNAKALMEQFGSTAGFGELQRLKQMGISLTPVSNVDLENVKSAAINLSKSQDATSARSALDHYISTVEKAKTEAGDKYKQFSGLYNIDTAPPASATQPAKINDDTGYNALPSGAQFMGPDGVLRRKP